ncbi:3' terminal RNA ribose 2'-O-methyltransferase Hen1 [Lacunimicrobium album]
MLLTISAVHERAGELGFLLHKHPGKVQEFELSFGKAHVFYPEASDARASACLMLDVDPVAMMREKRRDQVFGLDQYVNDRPYVASSLMSVAISQVYGSAMNGRCKDRPELVTMEWPLSARIDVLGVRGGLEWLEKVFLPLGYELAVERRVLDEQFPEWGESPYFSVTLSKVTTLSMLLTHLYVLIPIFDNQKHYYVGEDEIDKLLAKGAGWLSTHPEKEFITRRYLKYRASLYTEALARLVPEVSEEAVVEEETVTQVAEVTLETPLSLNDQRHGAVLAALKGTGGTRVLDLGCGEGKLLRELMKEKQFEEIIGMDVSIRTLEIASRRLKLDKLTDRQASRIKLLHGSLIYRDRRLEGFDAAALVEVIEHLDPARLAALERVVFEFARPGTVVVTTPNREYNVMWETLPAGQFRHSDHRFEWTRAEFEEWALRVAEKTGYRVRFAEIGPVEEGIGSPTQMGIFEKG